MDPHPPAPAPGMDRFVRNGAVVVALLVLAVTLFVAYASVIDAIQTWFEHQWVPVVRAVFALAVAGLAVWVLLRLTRRPAA